MKQNSYIPGDLVKLNNEVVTIAETNLFCYSIIDSNGDFYTNAMYENIKPIPLTPQILEKNGWKRGYFKYIEPFGFKKVIDPLVEWESVIYLNLSPAFNNEGFNFWFNNQKLKKVQHVHQLQHLLFGLGLDSNMIV